MKDTIKSAKKPNTKSAKLAKPAPTEEELVKRYANRVIKNQIYHGRVDSAKFTGMEHTHSVSKNLWMDSDFFFSVVFQSSEQKYAFLDFLSAKIGSFDRSESDQLQIINGVDLAKRMGLELKLETTKPFPTGNLELMPFVLDNEKVE